MHLARKAWHMASGAAMALGVALVPTSVAVGIFALLLAFGIAMETLRLQNPRINAKMLRLWAPVMRVHEANGPSTLVHYLAAVFLSVAVFPKAVAVLSIMYLAFGDPMASIMGILYGKRSIRFANGKSLVGTLAGVFTCFWVGWAILNALGFPAHIVVTIAVIGGLAGGLAEHLPLDVDDNISIPLTSGFVLWLAFILFGL